MLTKEKIKQNVTLRAVETGGKVDEKTSVQATRFRDGNTLGAKSMIAHAGVARKLTEPNAETSFIHETHNPKGSMNSKH